MAARLLVHVRWNWGGDKTIEVNSCDVIGECLETEGFVVPSNSDLFAAFRGQLISLRMSFSYYGMVDGSVIVLVMKKRKTHDRTRRFLESLKRKEPIVTIVAPDPCLIARKEEMARLNDLAFASWEAGPDYPVLIKGAGEMRRGRQAGDLSHREPTVIRQSSKICCDPLPLLRDGSERTVIGDLKSDLEVDVFLSGSYNEPCNKKP